ncbi:MAG: DUF975 family protein [Clostridiales bacterium]|nr:DUF975 family protein [Clostridiales bacterium]
MFKEIKGTALKKLFSDKGAAAKLILIYFVELAALMISTFFLNGNILMGLLFFVTIYMLSLGEYTVFLKLAEGKEVSSSDFLKCFKDKEYMKIYRSAGKGSCISLIFAVIPLILYQSIVSLLFVGAGFNDVIVYIIIMLIFALLFVFVLARRIFVSFILADINNKTLTLDREAKGDIKALNKKLNEGKYFDRIKFVLSFFGWFLLSLITLGIGFAFLIPYFLQSAALLYTMENKERLSH